MCSKIVVVLFICEITRQGLVRTDAINARHVANGHNDTNASYKQGIRKCNRLLPMSAIR